MHRWCVPPSRTPISAIGMIVSERTAPDGAHELLAVDLIEVGPALRGANPETYTVSAKTTTASTAPVYVNWHTTAVDHEAAT